MAVSASLHRNLLYLNQVILPSDEFKKHFREGMFDKPNTAGFVQVSYYLLTIYDLERFKKLVVWPVICKKSEATYRNNVKDFLMIISNENPDINFPNILTSHLFHAGGSKFTVIMWKLSQVAMRTYITREHSCSVAYAPRASSLSLLTKKFLQESIARKSDNIIKYHKTLSTTEEVVKTTLESARETLANMREEIFEKKQLLAKLESTIPVHPSIRKRLLNIGDEEVIQMWKTNIRKNIDVIQKRNRILKEIKELGDRVKEILINKSSDAKVLDGKELQRIDTYAIPESLPPQTQCFIFHLYKNDQLILNNFIPFSNSLLTHLRQWLKTTPLEDFSNLLLQVEASTKDMKLALDLLPKLATNIAKLSSEAQDDLCVKNMVLEYSDNVLPMMNNVLLMTSPCISIDIDCNDEKAELQNRLQLTPVEAAHKPLFARYERLKHSTMQDSRSRGNILVSRINFNDSFSTSNSEKSLHSRIGTPKKDLLSAKQAEKYSRLFSVRPKNHYKTVSSSTLSLSYSAKANSTALENAIGEIHDISQLSLDITTKSHCNFISDLASPKKLTFNEPNGPENTSEIDDVVTALPVEVNTFEIDETIKEENEDKDILNTKTKRRSIGDLVERYKVLLSNRNSNLRSSSVDRETELS